MTVFPHTLLDLRFCYAERESFSYYVAVSGLKTGAVTNKITNIHLHCDVY